MPHTPSASRRHAFSCTEPVNRWRSVEDLLSEARNVLIHTLMDCEVTPDGRHLLVAAEMNIAETQYWVGKGYSSHKLPQPEGTNPLVFLRAGIDRGQENEQVQSRLRGVIADLEQAERQTGRAAEGGAAEGGEEMNPTIPKALRDQLQQLFDDLRTALAFISDEEGDGLDEPGEWVVGDDMLAGMLEDLDAAKSALWMAQTRCGGKRGIRSCDSVTLFPAERGWTQIKPTTGPHSHVWLCPTCVADPVARWPYLSDPEETADNSPWLRTYPRLS